MKAFTAALFASSALASGPVEAVELTFSFRVDLVQLQCGGGFNTTLPFCGTPDPNAAVVVKVDLADPRADQDWSSAATFSAPFPTWSLPGGSGSATGSYVYDPITGIGTATLSSYGGAGSHDYPGELFHSFSVGPSQWQYTLNNSVTGRIARYSAGTPQSAAAFVGPATAPPPVPMTSRGLIAVLALALMAVVVAATAPRYGLRRAFSDRLPFAVLAQSRRAIRPARQRSIAS
ncbi:MAG: hypothetical protein IPK00_24965 [Deltaproteobacteria bacterium]|nr:hypothetical protein [Deltaproteobacteria bacterium]